MFVPAIIASRSDRLSGLQLVRKSAEMLKNLWGESLVVAISVGLAGFIMILGAFAGGALFSVIMTEVLGGAGLGLGIALTFITLIILSIIISTLGTIANTALYYYATHGRAPSIFSQNLLQSMVEQRKKRKKPQEPVT